MTEEELFAEVKSSLGFSGSNPTIDKTIKQKIAAVQLFMKNAGVTDENSLNALGVSIIVMGVNDLWEIKSGEIKFSPVFFTLVNQLSMG